MDKAYSPQSIERRTYQRWLDLGLFRPSGTGPPYSIVIPPPNVTGTLHMGHAFQDTIMDALSRFHRMRGDDTLWQPGTDHAGIATQMVVERQLNAEGRSRTDLTREQFLERVWQWKAHSGDTINRQLQRLGASLDWSRDRFTMDPQLSQAVTEAFVRLHQEGLIYRGKRLVNWDPVLLTAVSDLEVLATEEDGFLWHLRYPLADGGGHLTVATTRPETMLGDTAVAVKPGDARYAALVGRQLRLPLVERLIPIIADDYVDSSFGSGCVKITPAHDFNDYEIAQRHGLAPINIFTPRAAINENAPERFRGLDRAEARKLVVAELEALGLLERTEPYKLTIPRGDRSGAVIEPYLTDQWYVRMAALAGPAIEAVESGAVRFVPQNWAKTYFEWMRNIKDWCISRQLWWGHRIPAWYDQHGGVYVARDELQVRRQHGFGPEIALRQDDDVLDTWFSSALWPFTTLGWPQQTPQAQADLARYYPTSVLVTGFDIIFFWVARMIMMGLKFMGDVPFREVYIHALVRDHDGQKMSKSKGNVIDPLDIIDGITLEELVRKRTSDMMQPHLAAGIEKATRRQFPDGIAAYGTDALRFTFAALATQGRDIRFDLARVAGYRNFCNKLWNAARFVLMSIEGQPLDGAAAPSLVDRWIRSRLGETLRTVESEFAQYRFDLAAAALYQFTWHEFCDWYLELSKPVLQAEGVDESLKRGTRRTLLETLDALLRALHPLMPFITEEIWQRVAPRAGATDASIMVAAWPRGAAYAPDAEAETEIRWIQSFVLAIRQIRGEMDISPARKLPVLLASATAADLAAAQRHGALLARVAGVESVAPLDTAASAPPAAIALLGSMKILVPMAGLIDADAEVQRLGRRIAKLESDRAKALGKLANASFIDHAPAGVVQQERDRLAEFERSILGLGAQLERVRALLK